MQTDTDAYFLVSSGQCIVIVLIIVVMYLFAKVMAMIDLPIVSPYFKRSIYETWEYGGYFDALWTVFLYLFIGVLMQF